MNLKGIFLVFLIGTLSSIRATPHLQDNGYRDLLVYVGHDVPDEDAGVVVEQIKELLTIASDDMYYANQGRVYIKEVTIIVPSHWTQEMVPDLSGETVRGEIYQEADIQIGKMNKLNGEAPYTRQVKGFCGAPERGENGEPIQVSLEYLKGLKSKRDEMIVNYGPMGKLMAQEFAKYHHGISAEYGYPGKSDVEQNAERFPSLYLHSFKDKDGVKKMAAVDNYCSDVPLNGNRRNYKVEGDHLVGEECEIDDETGEITSPSCYFHADATGQSASSSIGSYYYTDMVAVFCDGSDWLPHNHEAPNLHNYMCDGASQWETIESHFEFANGNNPPVWIEDTTPTFYTKSQATSRFVLVIDYSGSMSSAGRIDHLKTSAVRWILQLSGNVFVNIVKFGCDAQYVTQGFMEALYHQQELMDAINNIEANGGCTNMAGGLKLAEKLMLDPSSPGHAGTIMAFTDGYVNSGTPIDDESVWGPLKRNSIRVVPILMGTEKAANIEKLARETKGEVFTVNYDGSDLDGTFDWASQTFIPPEVADRYEWMIDDQTYPGTLFQGKTHIELPMALDNQTNRDVTVTMRIKTQGAKDPKIEDYMKYAQVQDSTTGEVDTNFTFKMYPDSNQALLTKGMPKEGEYKVQIDLKRPLGVRFLTQVKVSGHRRSPSSEPYIVECKYPQDLKEENEFLITGFVKQGNTPVKGAIVYARVSHAMNDDPSGTQTSCIVELKDDGKQQVSGDIFPFDGAHSHILDPRTCFQSWDNAQVERMQVMCIMVKSPEAQVTDNDFFAKREADTFGLPTGDEVTPYCCGTSNQTWHPFKEVHHILRTTHNSSFKNELKMAKKDWLSADFGPPGRISDLKAIRYGDQESGLVQLKWTGAGADPAYGTPASYNVHYSTQRSNLYTRNIKMSGRVSSKMLTEGSLEPVPIGQEMSITVRIPDLEVPGTYHFAVRAVDPHGQEGKASNIASVNFHDGSSVVKDVSPHHVHGIPKLEMPLVEKLRKIYPDERMVQGALKKAEKTKQMVMEAENSVMIKRLRKRFGDNEKVLAKIIDTIKTNPEQRNIYKKILL